MMKGKSKVNILHKTWRSVKKLLGGTTNVYFISGMCYNCSVFDKIELPKGYKKEYIEWKMPLVDEPIEDYAHRMASKIDTRKKFILVGYSFGGIIAQEIACFLHPQTVILLSTMKSESEIPSLFHLAKRVNFANKIPIRMYRQTDFMLNLFNRYIYNVPTKALEGFMTVVDPVYIKWSLHQITHWIPKTKLNNLYHIHGTKDQVFDYPLIDNAIAVKGGDHLMVVKRSEEISRILKTIMSR